MALDPGKWVDNYGDILYRFALLRIGDPGLAEDLVQESLCSALESRERFSGSSTERTWLIGILKHKIADHFRKTSKEMTVIESDELPYGDDEFFDEKGRWKIMPEMWKDSPEDILENKEFWQVFHHCLDGLSSRIRQAFTLKELDEQDSVEICKVLEISSTNLWVMLHRARIGLRQCLELNWFKETR